MGIGNMFSKLFKKENGKGSSAATVEITHDDKIDISGKTESSKTENIHKLQTRDIEEIGSRLELSESKGDYMETEKDELDRIEEIEESVQECETVTEDKVIEILSDIYDPEIPVDIVNLGLIYGVSVENGNVNVKMTLTSPGCPTAGQMVQEAQMLIEELPGVKEAKVDVVWDPPWDPSKMSEEAKKALGYT